MVRRVLSLRATLKPLSNENASHRKFFSLCMFVPRSTASNLRWLVVACASLRLIWACSNFIASFFQLCEDLRVIWTQNTSRWKLSLSAFGIKIKLGGLGLSRCLRSRLITVNRIDQGFRLISVRIRSHSDCLWQLDRCQIDRSHQCEWPFLNLNVVLFLFNLDTLYFWHQFKAIVTALKQTCRYIKVYHRSTKL